MTDRNHCRVVIIDECNLSCEFCCMNDLEIYKSFETVRALYVAEKRYDEVCITGGEPLLILPKVVQFAALVRYFNPDVKIYLYTNGLLLNTKVAKTLRTAGIDGISLSIHNFPFLSDLYELGYINKCVTPLRILVGEHEATTTLIEFARVNKMDMRIWKMDDCKNMPEEDRYRIDWNRV